MFVGLSLRFPKIGGTVKGTEGLVFSGFWGSNPRRLNLGQDPSDPFSGMNYPPLVEEAWVAGISAYGASDLGFRA